MKTTKRLSVSVARVVTALTLSVSAIDPVGASEWTYKIFDPPAAYQGQFDLRFWFGQGNTSKNLYDTTGSLLVSRLTYNNSRSILAKLLAVSTSTTAGLSKVTRAAVDCGTALSRTKTFRRSSLRTRRPQAHRNSVH